MTVNVKFRRIYVTDQRPLPSYQTPGAAGMDLSTVLGFTLPPGGRMMIPTGFQVEIPPGYEGQIRPRSGLAREGISITNAPGTIDSDFRGEVCVLLENRGSMSRTFAAGDRIAQMVIAPVIQVEVEEVAELSDTKRGENGFGSTGTT